MLAADRQIPTRVLAAYQQAATTLTTEQPDCHLRWQLLAAIGKIESNHATGRTISPDGTISPTILGPRLDGTGEFARIVDTDRGKLDQDTIYDRAVGPLQFIPTTWTGAGRDGNHDGAKNPNNIDDAALAAGGYLCAHGRDLTDPTDLYAAIRAYNPSDTYTRAVLAWTTGYTTTPPTTGPAISPATSTPPTPLPPPGPAATSTPTPPATPFPIINLTPRTTTPATTPPPPPATTPTCPTITLTTSSLTATITTTSLDITGRYTTNAASTGTTAVIHAEARDTTDHTLTTTDTNIAATPPAGPTLIARLPLDHLTTPGQTTTITVALTTAPTGCPIDTLATLTISNITRPSTPAPPTATPSSSAPAASASPSPEAPTSTPATP